MSLLLRSLPLNAGDSSDSGAFERKKAKFVKYFSYFTKLLTRCNEEAKKTKKKAEKGLNLGESTISCLSNLLTANIDCGLQYFVTMGYHEDFDTRTAFLKVITNVSSNIVNCLLC
jgi:neurofibromin 1